LLATSPKNLKIARAFLTAKPPAVLDSRLLGEESVNSIGQTAGFRRGGLTIAPAAVGCNQFDSGRAEGDNVEAMHNEFTAVFERDGEWIVAYCPEIPGANGQGLTKDEARTSLTEAIALILQDRREDGLRGLPPDAERETVTVR
jgi:predicted RNase H-like HicB family nuclease